MNLIMRKQGEDKTDECIRLAAKFSAYMVCTDHKEAWRVLQRARELGLDMPFPLSFAEFLAGQHGSGARGFVIDNADVLLQRLANGVPLLGISATSL